MCDYSLHAVATRPAEVAERLVSTRFSAAGTRGFASPNNPKVAVCLRPGTELAPTNANQIRLQTSRIGQEHRPIRYQLPARLSFRQGQANTIASIAVAN
jgi:hypothetical protein